MERTNDITMGELIRNFDEHIRSDQRFREYIRVEIATIKDNHLAHIEPDMAEVKTNVGWLMKFFWVIATASIGGLVASVINLLQ